MFSKVVSEPSFVDRHLPQRLTTTKWLFKKPAETPKNLYYDFTVAKRFRKRNVTKTVQSQSKFGRSQDRWVWTTSVESRLGWRSFPKRESVKFWGGKIIVWLSQIYTKICALIFILHVNKWQRKTWYLGKRQSTPRRSTENSNVNCYRVTRV